MRDQKLSDPPVQDTVYGVDVASRRADDLDKAMLTDATVARTAAFIPHQYPAA